MSQIPKAFRGFAHFPSLTLSLDMMCASSENLVSEQKADLGRLLN